MAQTPQPGPFAPVPAPAAAAPAPRRVRTPRSGGGSTLVWQVLCGVLAVGLIAAVLVTLSNADNGNKWKDRATSSEALASQLQTKLAASEESNTALKARTISLAAEKAKAEDTATVNKVQKTFAATVSKQLDTCTAELSTVFDDLAAATTLNDLQAVSAEFDTASADCSAAANAADSLSQYLQNQ